VALDHREEDGVSGFALKPLTREGVPAALAKAEKYRVLNEPAEAESICLDILGVAPDDQAALVLLFLALTDQFRDTEGSTFRRAQEVLGRLEAGYQRTYYQGGPGAADVAWPWLREAMGWYEKAEALRPPGNDDALLRWNACVRTLDRLPPPHEEERGPALE
jgi:hypothetical protein